MTPARTLALAALLGLSLAAAAQPLPDDDERTPLPAPAPPEGVALKALNPGKTLFLESQPDGRKRVWVLSYVCLRQGALEMFLTKKMSKEHESILASDVDARHVHMTLNAAGAKEGRPVEFVPEYRPASGTPIKVSLFYRENGQPKTVSAREWIRSRQTKKALESDWVFAGSRLLKDPDDPKAAPYYTANNGDVISLANHVDSMLELPIKSSRDAAELAYEAATEKIPPVRTSVYAILEVAPAP